MNKKKDKHIVLMGFKNAGKSLLGKEVAERLSEKGVFVSFINRNPDDQNAQYFRAAFQPDNTREEVDKFIKTLDRGLKELGKLEQIDARVAFNLYQSYGFPLEITKELAEEKGQKLDLEKFKKEFDKHKDLSRTTSAGVFKGGLADHSPEVVKLHTATHLLLTSLREVLGEHVVQKGQNITKERSRFDFPNPEKLTDDQLQKVENFINGIINKDLPIKFEVMPKDQALATGAIHAFNEKYTDTVKIYYVGEELDDAISREFCGGPHVTHTGEIGSVKIKKQEKIGSGIIRLYIILNNSEFIS